MGCIHWKISSFLRQRSFLAKEVKSCGEWFLEESRGHYGKKTIRSFEAQEMHKEEELDLIKAEIAHWTLAKKRFKDFHG